MEIKLLNKISPVGLEKLDPALYHVGEDVENPDGILLRSFAMHDMELPTSLKAVARCGAGVNNIPIDKCSEQGIVVFNTPGANANAVKELVITALLLSSRKIVDGINWAKTLIGTEGVAKQVEKGKSAFVGPEIMGKTLGVVGLGAIGIAVANAARSLGMEVIGYDPYLSVDNAWRLSRKIVHAKDLQEVYQNSDYITLHVPLNDETRDSINAEAFSMMKKGVRLLNFSRGELVCKDALEAALKDGTVATYVTDFPNERVLTMDGVLALPHLGASTPESEDNCAVMAANQLRDFLENGNIVNSVNFPNCQLPRTGDTRVAVAHRNIPKMLSQISTAVSELHLNITNMINASKKDYAYTLLDIDGDVNESVLKQISDIDGVLSVRKFN